MVELQTLTPSPSGASVPIRLRFEHVEGPEGAPLVFACAEVLAEGDGPDLLGDEYWFRCITRFGDDGFWMYDVRTGALVLNRQWYALMGLEPRARDDLETLQTRLHPDDATRLASLFVELLSGRVERLSARLRLRHRDGHYLWIRHRAYVVGRDGDGRATSIVGHDVDISAEVKAEMRALRGELDVRRLLERLPNAVLVYGPDGDVRRWNRAAGVMLGVEPDAVPDAIASARAVGWDLVDGAGEPIPQDEVPIFQALRSGRPIANRVVGLDRGGERRWGLMSAVPSFDADGRLHDVVCTVTDITEARKLEAGLARAQRLESLGRLASGVAHDFNNLLTVVVSAAEMLADEVDPDSDAGAEVHELQHAARRGAELTRQLLGYARQSPPDARPLDLGRQVRAAVTLLRRLLPVDIKLVTRIADDLWTVHFDAAQFDQILVNLTVNAADAMAGRGGTLTIALDNHPGVDGSDTVRLRVIDSGPGMSPEVLGRAVEPFFTTKAVGAGTGLGLSTCYGLVRQHRGTLHIDSAPGQGTTVEIELPRTAREVRPSDPPDAAPLCASGQRVLLVEDETRVREATRRALMNQGYEVEIARDGLEAIRRLDAGVEPNVVVTDVALPGVDGPSFVRDLRRRMPGVPVLFVSGHDDPTLGRHGIDRNRLDFLAKPFGPRQLAQRIEALLQCSMMSDHPLAAGLPGQRRSPPSMSRQRPVK